MTEPTDFEKALLDPAKAFASPADVVTSSFDRAAKIELLQRWEHDARQLMTASDENMDGGDRPRLAQVHEALRALGVELTDLR